MEGEQQADAVQNAASTEKEIRDGRIRGHVLAKGAAHRGHRKRQGLPALMEASGG